ncbi:unnamed protein product, partial [Meganyctiphanes norvegica]
MSECESMRFGTKIYIQSIEYFEFISAQQQLQQLSSPLISHISISHSISTPPTPPHLKAIRNAFLVDDVAHSDLVSFFSSAADFIEDGQRKGNVLVHCHFGVSRSATLVACFLMRKYKITVDEALYRIKIKRPSIGPNKGFISQMLLYHTMNFTIQKSNILYKLYKLQNQNSSTTYFDISNVEEVFEEVEEILQADKDAHIDSEVAYKCKSCRVSLIHSNELIPHESGKNPHWTNKDLLSLSYNGNQCNKGIFTIPLKWMKEFLPHVEGKLLCFKCRAKIGAFNWVKGCVCPCGSKMHPGFCFVPSKVDRC